MGQKNVLGRVQSWPRSIGYPYPATAEFKFRPQIRIQAVSVSDTGYGPPRTYPRFRGHNRYHHLLNKVRNNAIMNHGLLRCWANLESLHKRDRNMNLTDHDRQKRPHLPQSQDSALLLMEPSHLPKGAHICSTKVICKSASKSGPKQQN